MGMYTEIFVRTGIKRGTPDDVKYILRYLTRDELFPPAQLPEHPLFETERWGALGSCTSAYFPVMADSRLTLPGTHERDYSLLLHANLKNYDSEIEKFFDWIDPYSTAYPGEFIGYSLYEDVDPETSPTIYFKKDN